MCQHVDMSLHWEFMFMFSWLSLCNISSINKGSIFVDGVYGCACLIILQFVSLRVFWYFSFQMHKEFMSHIVSHPI